MLGATKKPDVHTKLATLGDSPPNKNFKIVSNRPKAVILGSNDENIRHKFFALIQKTKKTRPSRLDARDILPEPMP